MQESDGGVEAAAATLRRRVATSAERVVVRAGGSKSVCLWGHEGIRRRRSQVGNGRGGIASGARGGELDRQVELLCLSLDSTPPPLLLQQKREVRSNGNFAGPRFLTFLKTSATTSPSEAALGILWGFRDLQRPRQAPDGEVGGGKKQKLEKKRKKKQRTKKWEIFCTRLPPLFFAFPSSTSTRGRERRKPRPSSPFFPCPTLLPDES